MAHSTGKKLIRIDLSLDTVCPWCFVGKKNLEKAIASSRDQYDFEIRYHPFFLNPDAPKEGILKSEFYRKRFGAQWEPMAANMAQIFRGLGYEIDNGGMTGNTFDSHRLINYAGTQGLDRQNAVVEELLLNYFVQGKYIGDKGVLAEAAAKVGIEGAVEFLEDPNKGVKEKRFMKILRSTHRHIRSSILYDKWKDKVEWCPTAGNIPWGFQGRNKLTIS